MEENTANDDVDDKYSLKAATTAGNHAPASNAPAAEPTVRKMAQISMGGSQTSFGGGSRKQLVGASTPLSAVSGKSGVPGAATPLSGVSGKSGSNRKAAGMPQNSDGAAPISGAKKAAPAPRGAATEATKGKGKKQQKEAEDDIPFGPEECRSFAKQQ
jgi:hypothetical protein